MKIGDFFSFGDGYIPTCSMHGCDKTATYYTWEVERVEKELDIPSVNTANPVVRYLLAFCKEHKRKVEK